MDPKSIAKRKRAVARNIAKSQARHGRWLACPYGCEPFIWRVGMRLPGMSRLPRSLRGFRKGHPHAAARWSLRVKTGCPIHDRREDEE